MCLNLITHCFYKIQCKYDFLFWHKTQLGHMSTDKVWCVALQDAAHVMLILRNSDTCAIGETRWSLPDQLHKPTVQHSHYALNTILYCVKFTMEYDGWQYSTNKVQK
jgi:hypothetical protein